MIRAAVLTIAFGALAAWPALAYTSQQKVAPRVEARFTDTSVFLHIVPGASNSAFWRDNPKAQSGTVVYDLSKGKAADRLNVTDPHDNPFMPQPELKAPAQAR